MNQTLQSLLEQHFKGLVLAPPLFYSWKNSIRFEISDPEIGFNRPDFMVQTFHRATTLFKEVFAEMDEILLVTDVLTKSDNTFLQHKPLNVYQKYIKRKEVLYQLQLQTFISEEDSNDLYEMVIHRFSLHCKKSDIRYVQLIQAICHADMGHSSTIMKSNPESGYFIYFINLTKKIIYYLYDDRGCDVLAADPESIRFLYDQYNEWILDYDRKEIDAVFSK